MEEKVASIISELDLADRAYFAKDRKKLIQNKIDEAIQMLDTKPIEEVGKFNSAVSFLAPNIIFIQNITSHR